MMVHTCVQGPTRLQGKTLPQKEKKKNYNKKATLLATTQTKK
jgi:hypothetical protein